MEDRLKDLIPAGIRLRANGKRSKPHWVRALKETASAPVCEVEKDGKTYLVSLVEFERRSPDAAAHIEAKIVRIT